LKIYGMGKAGFGQGCDRSLLCFRTSEDNENLLALNWLRSRSQDLTQKRGRLKYIAGHGKDNSVLIEKSHGYKSRDLASTTLEGGKKDREFGAAPL
jgi:hypothetical protein